MHLICTAHFHPPQVVYIDRPIQFMEKQFFSSVFTETHHNSLIKGNLVQAMKRLHGKQRFDDSLLIANNMTLKQLYER